MASARRKPTAPFFGGYYGSPPESKRGGRVGLTARIMHRVGVPERPRAYVRKAPGDVAAAQEGFSDEVFRGTERLCDVAPTGKRIVKDILASLRVLSKITEYEGCVAPGEVLRQGRRAVKRGLMRCARAAKR